MLKAPEQYDGLNATFNITEDCNLRCRYCYEVDKKPQDLPLEYAQKFIDLLLTDEDPIGVAGTENDWMIRRGLVLDFIGGDALMRPKLVEDILKYFVVNAHLRNHRWANRWRASISTNGTLFNDEVKAFLNRWKQNISLGISVDGCPEIHNLNRSDSMEAILKDWDWYVEFCNSGNTYPTTKSTLNRDSIPYLYQSLRFLHEDLGLNYINQNFIFEPMGETEDDLKELDRQMAQCVEYVAQHKNDLYWGMLERNFQECRVGDPDTGWCGAGAMPCLSINGKVYPCFRFLPHTMHDRALDFHVGDVWNGFDHKERFCIVRDQKRSKISPKECLECEWERGCPWCIGGAYSEKGEFYRQTNICGVHKIQAKWTEIYWRNYGSDVR